MQQELLLYTLRRSSRAKSVRLHITPADGLLIVIPQRFNLGRLPGILEEKRPWIEKATSWAAEQRALRQKTPAARLPQSIHLQAIGESRDVIYRPSDAKNTRAVEKTCDELVVCGAATDIAASRLAIKRWLKRKAQLRLVPLLYDLSDETGLGYKKTNVGNQRSLWASCSQKGTISINQKMLFLPELLVRYIFIHELCHTVHLNHSSRFWAQVSRLEPGFKQMETELRAAGRFVPAWAH